MENQNYYEILGVSVHASMDEINAAKLTLAKKYHPDANLKDGVDTTDQMQLILEAHRILSDPHTREEYDRTLSGRRNQVPTFDLQNEEEFHDKEPEFVTYWKAANALYDIITESALVMQEKKRQNQLARLAKDALRYILILRASEIPEKYWHPDTMNWLLFTWYQNRNYTPAYLITLYDEHIKKDFGHLDKFRLQNKTNHYQKSVKKLMKY